MNFIDGRSSNGNRTFFGMLAERRAFWFSIQHAKFYNPVTQHLNIFPTSIIFFKYQTDSNHRAKLRSSAILQLCPYTLYPKHPTQTTHKKTLADKPNQKRHLSPLTQTNLPQHNHSKQLKSFKLQPIHIN